MEFGQPKQGVGSANERLEQQNPGQDGDSRKQGGQGGYSTEQEQQQVSRENEQMHNERNQEDLDTSEQQMPRPNEGGGSAGREGNDDYKRNR